MTKSELIEAVALRTRTTKSRAELVVNCVFDTMTAALERGEGIEIRGFGSFTVREYMPYDGRNPRTGKAVPVPQKRLPFFKVGKELKVLVNGEQPASAAAEPTVLGQGAIGIRTPAAPAARLVPNETVSATLRALSSVGTAPAGAASAAVTSSSDSSDGGI